MKTYNKIQEYIDNDIIVEFRIDFEQDIANDDKMYLFEVTLRRGGYSSVGFDHWPTWNEILEELFIK